MNKKFILYINAFNPQTIPMARLAEYMDAFAKLLGNKEYVHFSHLETGSTQIACSVDHEAEPKVQKRILGGDSVNEVEKAKQTIDGLLLNDNADGWVYDPDLPNRKIIYLAGVKREKPLTYGPFNEISTIQGRLISIRGADETAHLILKDFDKQISKIETDQDMARDISQYLFEPVRLTGEARWFRSETGDWELQRFRVLSFQGLRMATIGAAIKEMREDFHLRVEKPPLVSDFQSMMRDDDLE
ncbi:hypothetical protein [Marivivens donghaensis]|jgi:hypothetical protein|uniref:hypothetical protein n=1 Tax=Marivivens donghaensis TaxID=1699413 RepID=UPI003F6A31C0